MMIITRLRPLIAALFLSVISVSAAHSQQLRWQPYASPDFGYRIDIPSGLFLPAGEEDGRLLFEEAGGSAVLTVYGLDAQPGQTLESVAAGLAGSDAVEEVTYRKAGRSWVVLSGYYKPQGEAQDSSIFYLKLMTNRDRSRFAVFAISHPPADKRRFDPIVTRLEKSFRPPA